MTSKLYVSDQMFKDSLISIIKEMNGWRPDVIIGPSRGALQMGVMLSHFFDVPFKPFEWQTRDGKVQNIQQLNDVCKSCEKQDVLLVDDINDTGTTLTGILNVIQNFNVYDCKIATIFNKTTSSFDEVDYYAHELTPDTDKWIVFPYEEWWNLSKYKEN